MKRIVINGTFDILHLGHIRLLNYARSIPNSYVYVLIDSDLRVKQLKGSSRPVNSEYERASLLHALRSVDRVDIFDTDDELREYIRRFQPDLMIKGSDYRGQTIIGSEYCGDIEFFDRLERYSTTNKVNAILASAK
jgi:D-beta-D-heptose 7-phosphate kinase/D-beta-D-heptose 1-phosphate adenosyltransferase